MDKAYITLFPRAEASLNQSKTVEMSWQEIATNLTDFTYVSEKSETMLLIPARFKESATTKHKKFVLDVWLASLDVDGASQEEFDALVAVIRERKLKAAIYSTYRHLDSIRGIGKKGEEIEPEVRARVVLPLSRPVDALEWQYFWKAYNSYFFELADKSCKDPSRGYFVPSVPIKYRGTEIENLKFAEIIDGEEVLDVDWLLESYKHEIHADKGDVGLPDQEDAHSVDSSLIYQLARRLKGRKRSDLQVIGAKMLQGIRGEIFEASGHRDNMLFKFAKELAHMFPNGKVKDLAAPFQAAIQAMAEDSGDEFDETWLTDKILRAQAEELAELRQKALEREQQQFEEERAAKKRQEKLSEYTPELIREFLANVGVEMDVDDFKLILSFKANYYLFNGEGYSGPYVAADLILACKKHLEIQAKSLHFSLYDKIDKEDGPPILKPRNKEKILALYGAVVASAEYNLVGKSYYDPEADVLHLSAIRKCQYVAEFVPEVDEWLRSLCETSYRYEKLLDYLSQVPNTMLPQAALCIIGASGIGKSTLAEGISRLWGESFVPMDVALGAFNEELLRSPVLFADEDLPRDYRGKVQTEQLRKLISSNTHSVNRKNLARVILKGNLRCIVALNNIENFNFGNSRHSRQDVEAIQKRFLVLDLSKIEADACRELCDYDMFVMQGGIAKHILHLAATRARADDRFGVVTDSTNQIALGDDNVIQILDLIADTIEATRSQEEEGRHVAPLNLKGVIIAPGRRVLINPTALYDDWEALGDIRKRPTKRRMSTTLSAISIKEKISLSVSNKRNRHTFYEADVNLLEEHVYRRDSELLIFQKKLDIYYDIDFCGQYSPTQEDADRRDAAVKFLENILASDEEAAE